MRRKIITERILLRNYNSWNTYVSSTVIGYVEEGREEQGDLVSALDFVIVVI